MERLARVHPELIEQLIHFPLDAYDDAPDAHAGAIELITADTARETATKKVLIPRAR